MPDFGSSSVGGGFPFLFSAIPILVVVVFVIVIGGILFNVARYLKNASSPRESVYARVVAKRTEVRSHTSHHNNGNGAVHPVNTSHTYYYITLEFEDGKRKEFLDVKSLYGLVIEGDTGYAAIQREWIVAFERVKEQS